jgi:hypothetical protein
MADIGCKAWEDDLLARRDRDEPAVVAAVALSIWTMIGNEGY